MIINMEVKGLDKVMRNLRKVGTAGINACVDGINNALKVVKTQANDNLYNLVTPGTSPSRGDSVRDSWEIIGPNKSESYIEGILTSRSPHSLFLEYGTGLLGEKPAGPILPREKSVLKFVYKGELMYRPYVRGQYPLAFFRNAVESQRNNIRNIIGNTIRDKIAGAIT